jgi:glucose/mannose-6-phosphate isomerase
MPKVTTDGPERMRALALRAPDQFLDGFRAGVSLATEVPSRARAAVAVGMGGSAIAGDLLLTLTDSETELALSVVRSPDLPKPVANGTLALITSYSGNTWETLSAFEEAGRRGVPRVAITSGGALAERAADAGVPCLVVPAGGPPRAWVPFIFGGLLGLLDRSFPASNETRAARAADALQRRLPSLAGARGVPARLAARLGHRRPTFFAEASFAGLARRLKTQVEENAKRLAEFDAIPELFHNRIVAVDALRRGDTPDDATVLLEWRGMAGEARDRFRYFQRTAESRGLRVLSLPLPFEDRLDAILHGLSVGDFLSLALARAAGVDPYPVDAITRMKAALEPRSRGRAAAKGAPSGRGAPRLAARAVSA